MPKRSLMLKLRSLVPTSSSSDGTMNVNEESLLLHEVVPSENGYKRSDIFERAVEVSPLPNKPNTIGTEMSKSYDTKNEYIGVFIVDDEGNLVATGDEQAPELSDISIDGLTSPVPMFPSSKDTTDINEQHLTSDEVIPFEIVHTEPTSSECTPETSILPNQMDSTGRKLYKLYDIKNEDPEKFIVNTGGNQISDKKTCGNNSDKMSNPETFRSRSTDRDSSPNQIYESETDDPKYSRGGKANSTLFDDDIAQLQNDSEFDDEEDRQNLRIDVSLVQFDETGRLITEKVDTPGRLPPPGKDTDDFHFVSEQFLIESQIFYRTTGGKIIYDATKKKFVACYTDKTQEDALNYDAIRSFMKTLGKCGLNLRGCVLSFYGGIRENRLSVVSYAKCKYSSHDQRFKFEMNDIHQSVTTVSVYATKYTGEIVHEGLPIMEPLRKEERDYVKHVLAHTSPVEYYDQVIKSTDINMIREGDFGKIRNLPTYHQANLEMSNDKKRYITSTDVSDMMQRYKDDQMVADPYIRRVGEPFHIHLYSREQLNTVRQGDKVAYFDSTGSVVRKPDDNLNNKRCEPSIYKRVFYYAMVILKSVAQTKTSIRENRDRNNENDSSVLLDHTVKIKKVRGIQIPMLEMVTCEQDIASISLLLAKYKIFVHSEKIKWPLFRVVVIDWSWALINAILKEWSGMAIGAYLKMAYNVTTDNGSVPSDIVTIQNCCAHFQNRVSRKISTKFSKHKTIKTFILEGTGILIQCQTISDLDVAYESFMILLLTKSSEVAQKALVRLNNVCGEENDEDNEKETDDDDNEKMDLELIEDGEQHGSIFADSPFYHRYFFKLLSIMKQFSQEETDEIQNEYYAPEIAHYITKTYMPYAPLWSGILLSKVVPGTIKLSNAPAEGHFRIVKHDLLRSRKGLAIGEFVEITRNYKSRACTRSEVQALLKGERPFQKQRLNLLQGPQNPLVKERWVDKSKRSRAPNHLDARNIKSLAKKSRIDPIPVQQSASPSRPNMHFDSVNIMNDTSEWPEVVSKKRGPSTSVSTEYDSFYGQNKSEPTKKIRIAANYPRLSTSVVHQEKMTQDVKSVQLNLSELSADNLDEPNKSVSLSSTSSIDSTHHNALNNALFDDPDYYRQVILIDEDIEETNVKKNGKAHAEEEKKNRNKKAIKKVEKRNKKKKQAEVQPLFYYIGQYCNNDLTTIMGTANMNLCSQDYLSLEGQNFINGPAIDCYAIGKLNTSEWENVTYVPTIETMYLLGDHCSRRKHPSWSMYHVPVTLKGTILLPYTWKLHWRLLILNVNDRTIRVLDPISIIAFDRNRVADEFKRYIQECKNNKAFATNNLCNIDWKLLDVTENRPLQRDGYNCGAYITYYMDCIATGKQMHNNEFDPGRFRVQVSHELLRMSHSVQYMCYLCAGDSKEWSVQCETCKRWTHLKCAKRCEHDFTNYLVEKTAVYLCALCKNIERPWMKD